jgi:hypothetical protein
MKVSAEPTPEPDEANGPTETTVTGSSMEDAVPLVTVTTSEVSSAELATPGPAHDLFLDLETAVREVDTARLPDIDIPAPIMAGVGEGYLTPKSEIASPLFTPVASHEQSLTPTRPALVRKPTPVSVHLSVADLRAMERSTSPSVPPSTLVVQAVAETLRKDGDHAANVSSSPIAAAEPSTSNLHEHSDRIAPATAEQPEIDATTAVPAVFSPGSSRKWLVSIFISRTHADCFP